MLDMAERQKLEIEQFAADLRADHPMFRKAANGELDGEQVKSYLYNVHYLFKNTTKLLARAREICLQRDLTAEAEFFAEKQGRVRELHLRVEADLKRLDGYRSSREGTKSICNTVRELVEFLREITKQDPRLKISYLTLSDYFATLYSEEFLQNLERCCGIDRDQMMAFGHYGQHSHQQDFQGVQRFVQDQVSEETYFAVQTKSMRLMDGFFAEVAGATRR